MSKVVGNDFTSCVHAVKMHPGTDPLKPGCRVRKQPDAGEDLGFFIDAVYLAVEVCFQGFRDADVVHLTFVRVRPVVLICQLVDVKLSGRILRQESGKASGVIPVPMGEDSSVDVAQIYVHPTGILQKGVGVSGIEQDSLIPLLDQKAQAVLASEGCVGCRIFNQNMDFHGGRSFRWSCLSSWSCLSCLSPSGASHFMRKRPFFAFVFTILRARQGSCQAGNGTPPYRISIRESKDLYKGMKKFVPFLQRFRLQIQTILRP